MVGTTDALAWSIRCAVGTLLAIGRLRLVQMMVSADICGDIGLDGTSGGRSWLLIVEPELEMELVWFGRRIDGNDERQRESRRESNVVR